MDDANRNRPKQKQSAPPNMVPKRKTNKRIWLTSRTCVVLACLVIAIIVFAQTQENATASEFLRLSETTHVASRPAPISPTHSPTQSPVVASLPALTYRPTNAPVPKPTAAPVPKPTTAPVPKPTAAPIPAPTSSPSSSPIHFVAGLSCADHGGPEDPSEMVYWRDIADDTAYRSPLYDANGPEKYLTFEPDEGGWNNIRMALETAIALAHGMGRTLVLPPKMKFYLLNKSEKMEGNVLTYDSFFHIDAIAAEHSHFNVISFEEYLLREAMTGKLRNRTSGEVSFPPYNRTDWSSINFANFVSTRGGMSKELWEWVRSVTQPLDWSPDKCVAAIPSQHEGNATERFDGYLQDALQKDAQEYSDSLRGAPRVNRRIQRYNGRPTPVNGTTVDRLREMLGFREKMCVYTGIYDNATTLHAIGETRTGFRLLVHWYAYVFFESWRQDVHMKRYGSKKHIAQSR